MCSRAILIVHRYFHSLIPYPLSNPPITTCPYSSHHYLPFFLSCPVLCTTVAPFFTHPLSVCGARIPISNNSNVQNEWGPKEETAWDPVGIKGGQSFSLWRWMTTFILAILTLKMILITIYS